MSTPECHVNTNRGNELVVMTSIFGKRELVNCVRDAVNGVLRKFTEQFVFTWHRSYTLLRRLRLLVIPMFTTSDLVPWVGRRRGEVYACLSQTRCVCVCVGGWVGRWVHVHA